MEQRQECPLGHGIQIDQEIAARQKVELREGGIGQEVVHGKHDQIPNLLLHAIAVLFLGKEPPQAVRREVPGNADRIEARARRLDGPTVQIRRKNLHGELTLLLREIFTNENCERVGFLSGGTAGHPQTHGRVLRLALHERREHGLPEDLERLRIPKEAGDADEQFLKQGIEFRRIGLQKPEILSLVLDLVHIHPAFDAPMNRILFIAREIVSGSVAQEDEDLLHGLRGLACRETRRRFGEAPRIREQ